jgi:hypothetical protein
VNPDSDKKRDLKSSICEGAEYKYHFAGAWGPKLSLWAPPGILPVFGIIRCSVGQAPGTSKTKALDYNSNVGF